MVPVLDPVSQRLQKPFLQLWNHPQAISLLVSYPAWPPHPTPSEYPGDFLQGQGKLCGGAMKSLAAEFTQGIKVFHPHHHPPRLEAKNHLIQPRFHGFYDTFARGAAA